MYQQWARDLQGNGDGSLTFVRTIETGCSWVAAADFNGDGNPDLAVGSAASNGSTGNQVSIYLGDGHGGFSAPVNSNVDFTSSDGNACSLNGTAVAADFTGDKITDLFITADCPNDVVSASAVIFGKGDKTGHFAFHKDVETQFDSGMNLRLTEGNNDGKNDVVAVGQGSAPHGAGSSALMLFLSHGDGTFESKPVISEFEGSGPGNIVRAGAFADFDGDRIKDGIAMMDSFDDVENETRNMQFFKGQSDGTYKLVQTSALASEVLDMVWGDFDREARPDIALVRPDSTDVWLNSTGTAPECASSSGLRTLRFCTSPTSAGPHFLSSPTDNLTINAIQVYIDGVLKFETPEDLLDINLQLGSGSHRITVKAWDALGPFSSTLTTAEPCTNATNRTVKICTPPNGASITATGGQATVEVIASAATNLKFSSIQLYVDGLLRVTNSSKSMDTQTILSTGTHRLTVKGWGQRRSFLQLGHCDSKIEIPNGR